MQSPDVRGYQELRIEIRSPDGGAYTARLTAADDSIEGRFTVAGSPDAIEQTIGSIWNAADLRPVRKGVRESLNPVSELGAALYTGLFSGPRETFFRQCQERAAAMGMGLRLQFALADERAALLPLEFLFDGRDFLALSSRTPIIRTVMADLMPQPSLQTGLRVLAVTSDLHTARGHWAEMTRRLYADLQQQFARLQVTLVEDVTPSRLREALNDGPYDVLHFSGHADKTAAGNSALFLQGEGRAEYAYVDARGFASALERAKDLKLICLDACNSLGLGFQIAQQTRVPAIYGIHNIISDESANSFIRGFLTALLGGQTLTVAATNGRQAIDQQRPGSREWGLPVLYTGYPDAQLVFSEWQAAYGGSSYGGSKGLPEPSPAPVEGAPTEGAPGEGAPAKGTQGPPSRERQKLEAWLAIKRKNLQGLEQELAASSYVSPEAQAQAGSLRDDIARLETQLGSGDF